MNTIEDVKWVNGHTRFKEVDQNWITDRILNSQDKSDTHLYIHGPFCAQLCSFCMHQGVRSGSKSPSIKKYYFEYLPDLLESYIDVFNSSNISAVYFGGGTADVMPSKSMQRIFNSIPDFEKIPSKVFEAHPASLTSEQISNFARYNFKGGYVSFGLQTFDQELCKRDNRIYVSPEKVSRKVSLLLEHDIPVNVDLIAFLGGANEQSLKTLKTDIENLINVVKPSIITIYPLRQAFNYMGQLTQLTKASGEELELLNNKRILLANKLFELLNEIVNPNSEYRLWESPIDRANKDSSDFFSECMKPKYLTRLSDSDTDSVRAYNSSTPPFHDRSKSVLGFGNFGRIYSHSYVRDEIVYYTMNDSWNTRYFVVHDKNDTNLNLDIVGWEVEDL